MLREHVGPLSLLPNKVLEWTILLNHLARFVDWIVWHVSTILHKSFTGGLHDLQTGTWPLGPRKMDLVRKSACGSNLEALALEQGIVLARVGHTRMVAMHAISTHPQFFCYQMAITKKRFFFSSPFCIYVPCANDSTHHLFFFPAGSGRGVQR